MVSYVTVERTSFSWIILVKLIKLNVLVLLRDDLSLNLSCSICRAPYENQNRSTSKSSECCQVSDLFHHSRTSSKNSQKCWSKNRYPAKNLKSIQILYRLMMINQNVKFEETEEGEREREDLTVLMKRAVLLPGRTRGMDAPCRFNCSLTSSGSSCRKV